jgi:hypothetical protein
MVTLCAVDCHCRRVAGCHYANGRLAGWRACSRRGSSTCGARVIGVRGMWDGANLTGSNPGPVPAFTGPFTLHTKVSSFASVVGEVGYLFTPTIKFYGKAGIGWVRDRFTCDEGCSFGGPPTVVDDTRNGLDLGLLAAAARAASDPITLLSFTSFSTLARG